jgi:protein transport protein SEC61 subunit gamma-like protein
MIKKLLIKFKTFIIESKRVFQITKKPSKTEFQTIVKVTAIGVAIIGLLGFIIQIGYILAK